MDNEKLLKLYQESIDEFHATIDILSNERWKKMDGSPESTKERIDQKKALIKKFEGLIEHMGHDV